MWFGVFACHGVLDVWTVLGDKLGGFNLWFFSDIIEHLTLFFAIDNLITTQGALHSNEIIAKEIANV